MLCCPIYDVIMRDETSLLSKKMRSQLAKNSGRVFDARFNQMSDMR